MERKFYTDDFEQLLKEQSDEFRMYPSKRVWHSIYNDLHPGRKWPSVAVSMLLIIALLMMGYWNSNTNDKAIHSTIVSILPAGQNTTTNNFTIAALSADNKNITSSVSDNNINPAKNDVSVNGNAKRRVATAVKKLLGPSTNNAPPASNKATNVNKENSDPDLVSVETNDATTLTQDGKTNMIITSPVIDESLETSTGISEKENNELTADKLIVNTATATKLKTTITTEDKAWIEDYAFHNKSKRKPWKDRTTLDLYLTPNVTYRKLSNDSKYNLPSPANSFAALTPGTDANSAVNQQPGLGLEAGLGITYSVGKNFRIKAGVQANYTNYGVNAEETNHPVSTTLMMIDRNSGNAYLSSNSSTLSNSSGLQAVRVHNKTYQFSMPVGMAFKIMGNDKLEFYAGAAIQPTFVLGGKANLISADRKNYVTAPSLIRKWNVNTGFETYIHYKLDGFTLQAGPQFRYQLFSTYDKKYTVNENLYGMGIKVGILKNF
jgi:hypothetical protein